MCVDQIKQKISHLLLASLLLSSCQLPWAGSQGDSRPAPSPSARLNENELAHEPPLPLKQLGSEPVPSLQVLGSLSSRDRAGHRRLQLYLSHPAPNQAFYWQIVNLYRSQYDVIWIYSRSAGGENGKAAWFAPEVPKSFHIPGFKPKADHDGLYWANAL